MLIQLVTILQPVIVTVVIERVGPGYVIFLIVVKPVAITVAIERVGPQSVDFKSVGKPVIVRIRVVRVCSQYLFLAISQPVTIPVTRGVQIITAI